MCLEFFHKWKSFSIQTSNLKILNSLETLQFIVTIYIPYCTPDYYLTHPSAQIHKDLFIKVSCSKACEPFQAIGEVFQLRNWIDTISSSHKTHSSLPARELLTWTSGHISVKAMESQPSYQKEETRHLSRFFSNFSGKFKFQKHINIFLFFFFSVNSSN